MAESSKHLDLVHRILDYILSHYSGVDHVATLHDLPCYVGCEKPPKIGRFRPDVYAIDAPLTRAIVGEAKTQSDLEANHSKEQFTAYFAHLRLQPRPLLIVAVPWQAKATAQSLLHVLRNGIDAASVEIVVIDDVEECACQ